MDEGLLDKIKSIFKKSKKDVKLKEDTAEEMLDKLGVYELDDISDEDLVSVTSIYKKTVGMNNFPELNQGSSIDYIHGYIYGFQFAVSNGLKCKEKKTFKYKDGIEWNKKLK